MLLMFRNCLSFLIKQLTKSGLRKANAQNSLETSINLYLLASNCRSCHLLVRHTLCVWIDPGDCCKPATVSLSMLGYSMM